MADEDETTETQDYEVSVPVIGTCYVTVEASSPDEAFDLAVDAAYEKLEADGLGAIEQYEATRLVSAGNFWLVDVSGCAEATDAEGTTHVAEFQNRW